MGEMWRFSVLLIVIHPVVCIYQNERDVALFILLIVIHPVVCIYHNRRDVALFSIAYCDTPCSMYISE